jgi:hypothetical protein
LLPFQLLLGVKWRPSDVSDTRGRLLRLAEEGGNATGPQVM